MSGKVRQTSESVSGRELGSAQKTSLRVRSASVGRSRDYDLRCRYWAFLFDNLNRAVDEIYQNCERDESIVECKEAMMVLDNYKREFSALIEWLNLNIDYEATPPPERPNSLTWEVRKSMPKSVTHWNTFFNRHESILKSSHKTEPKEKTVPEVEDQSVVVDKALSDKSSEESFPVICSTCPVVVNSSKPLNPLARSFTSRLQPISTPSATTAATTVTTTLTTTNTPTAPVLKKTAPTVESKPVPKPVTAPQTNLTKRTVVSAPNLTLIINNGKPLTKDSAQQQNQRRSEPKITVTAMMNKNFAKETNSSRAKNVRNQENYNPKIGPKGQNNILSTRNLNVRHNPIPPKTKKVKDADGWETVANRGRPRFKSSPPKVIIVEDESLVKTTADGTVIAVSAAAQTSDDWNPMCSSWNSQTDSTEHLRTPGKAIQLHEKLSSPSRKRNVSPTESIKRHEEKLAKAQEAREKYLEKKAEKFRGIAKKVEEMKAWKEEQQMQMKASMERKHQKAEEMRQQQLNRIVRKAHDEDSKVNEILFINKLEAQNKSYDIMSKETDRERRLQDLNEERHKRMEEKLAKEAAVEERRKLLEEERQQRIQELQQKRRLKDQKIEQQMQEKEKERQEMASQKALERQEKLDAVNALLEQTKKDLQKKIQQKQEETKRRHEENMAQIKQKALELSVRRSSSIACDDVPVNEPYDTCKWCQLCQVVIKSEVFLFGHLRGKKHLDAVCEQNGGKVPTSEELENFNVKHIIEAPDGKDSQSSDTERLKASRKRSKKLRQRLQTKAKQFETNQSAKSVDSKTIQCPNRNRIAKLVKDLTGLSADTRITGQWPSNMIQSLERIVTELEKTFRQKGSAIDCLYFQSVNGIQLLTKLLARILNGTKERPTSLTDRANQKLCALFEVLCAQSPDISDSVLQSQLIIDLLDIVWHRINLSDESTPIIDSSSDVVTYDPVIGSLCRLLSRVFDALYHKYSLIDRNTDDYRQFERTVEDVISYIVSIGMMDRLSLFMCNTRGPIDLWPDLALFLQNIISFFSSISIMMSLKVEDRFGDRLVSDETQLMLTLQMTHMCGAVSLIYGVLLHSGAPVRDEFTKPQEVSEHTLVLTLEAIRFLNYVSLLDLNMVQCVLGSEGLSLQLRHICSYLLWYCTHNKCQNLLNEVILLIGNFVVLNTENQTLLQSGQRPTVVQQLCSLPFEYFSDDRLSALLFPTLIACCFHNSQNRLILSTEMCPQMLSQFIESTIVGLQLRAVDSQLRAAPLCQQRLSFAKRFPKNRWNEAKDYFEAPATIQGSPQA